MWLHNLYFGEISTGSDDVHFALIPKINDPVWLSGPTVVESDCVELGKVWEGGLNDFEDPFDGVALKRDRHAIRILGSWDADARVLTVTGCSVHYVDPGRRVGLRRAHEEADRVAGLDREVRDVDRVRLHPALTVAPAQLFGPNSESLSWSGLRPLSHGSIARSAFEYLSGRANVRSQIRASSGSRFGPAGAAVRDAATTHRAL